jgi:uncharacterized protein
MRPSASEADSPDRAPANRLAREKSPYLLQHAHNPVDWYPWGDEAFARARAESRPLFLSIGYSTCHWCHVMERESFEDAEVAAALNAEFVCIKVDREERPDVDRVYMTALQAMGMGGGWPLNAFLTPELHPFFGGTYFPPRTRSGRPGLIDVARRVGEVWRTQRPEVEESGRRIIEALETLRRPESGPAEREPLFASCATALARSADHTHGGFGSSPKFPSVVNLDFLLRWWARDRAARPEPLDLVVRQLEHMAAGGIHDHLGGGFHRYSTDAEWLVPHFEKMLYDQAQLAWSFLDTSLAAGRDDFAETARGIFRYVARDLTAPGGAFHSAEDADSEGEEGRFYVWTPAQLEALLAPVDAALVADAYDVTAGGNFEHSASILHRVRDAEALAVRHGLPAAAVELRLDAARAKLLAARGSRVRPHLDDKIITAWNGLMIAALARGARTLDEPEWGARAAAAAEWVWTHLVHDDGARVARRWREGEAAGAGQLDDYAALAFGFIELYQATFDPVWLERGERLSAVMIERFFDPEDGAFFESPPGDPSITVRMKDDFDGAEIAGNSLAALVVQQLATLLDRAAWRDVAKRTFDYYARRLRQHAVAMPRMLVAMDVEQAAPRHVVIAGDPTASDTRALIREHRRRFLPHDVLLVVPPGEAGRRLAALVPFTSALVPRDRRATAYVCIDYSCRLPVTDPAAFAAQLVDPSPKTARAGQSN